MPCYEVRLVSVEFKAAHRDLLLQALKEMGWSYRERGSVVLVGDVEIDLERQRVRCPQSSMASVNKLKQKYSEVTLKKVAEKKKWSVVATGKNKFKLRKWA